VIETTAATCPECGAPVATTDNFCERCGRELSSAQVSADLPAAACQGCGSSVLTPDGYCEQCGYKAPVARDHIEIDLGSLAGITDRGKRHGRNEDAMALAVTQTPAGPVALAVVCDGVSTSHRPDDASLAAAEEALRVLMAEVRAGSSGVGALTAATVAAQAAVGDIAPESANAPATTIVCAHVTADSVTIGWVGDSRAYWLPADDFGARLLTQDDSVGAALAAVGVLTEAEAIGSSQGHVLTRWLGADAEHDEPNCTSFEPPGPGAVLLCSDGLWNYEPTATGLAELATPHAPAHLAEAAARLVEFALDRGGEDNITAVLASFPPS
jgi:serine/threonine protein phosphatase PrpC/DNA-directed RNA polymerase subunit RPC12/RpoP